MTLRKLILGTILTTTTFTFAACSQAKDGAKAVTDSGTQAASQAAKTVTNTATTAANSAKLAAVLSAQDDKAKARYTYRNPEKTLTFFGITPGMTVAEALPGGGWYSKILLPYLGDDGGLIGMDYDLDMWALFGGFANAEFLEKKKAWPTEWTAKAKAWPGGENSNITAFAFGNRDAALDGTVDAVLFIRAMHNLNRFSDEHDYLGSALKDSHALLKEGGTLGVIQHRGPEDHPDEWATGKNGYLKQSAIIAKVESAGFKLVGTSEINANPQDQPTTDDIVWRLPPSLGTSRDNPDLQAKLKAIGESDRMTLKFKKL